MPRRQIHGPAIFNADPLLPTLFFQNYPPPRSIFFSPSPRSDESHGSTEHAAVPSGSCVYIGAGLARNSCLFKGIMATLVNGNGLFPSHISRRAKPSRILEIRKVDIEGISPHGPPRSLSTLKLSVLSNV